MKHTTLFRVNLAAVILFILQVGAFAEGDTIAICSPEIKSLRQAFRFDQSSASPNNDISRAWNQISIRGRELLLREAGLSVVIIDSKGAWSYRTASIPTLRMYPASDPPVKSDIDNLILVLRSPLIQQMTDFFEKMTRQNIVASADIFAKALDASSKNNNIDADQKKWFKELIGSEINKLSMSSRSEILEDKQYGKMLEAASKLDQDSIAAQRFSLNVHDSEDPNPKTDVMIDSVVSDFSLKTGEDISAQATEAGKKILLLRADGVNLYLATKPGIDYKSISSSKMDLSKVKELIREKKVKAYVGPIGSKKTTEVK